MKIKTSIILFIALTNSSFGQIPGFMDQILPCTLDSLPRGARLIATPESIRNRMPTRINSEGKSVQSDEPNGELKHEHQNLLKTFQTLMSGQNDYFKRFQDKYPNKTIFEIPYDQEIFKETYRNRTSIINNVEVEVQPDIIPGISAKDYYEFVNFKKTPLLNFDLLDLGENNEEIQLANNIKLSNLNRFAQNCGGSKVLGFNPRNKAWIFRLQMGQSKNNLIEIQGRANRPGSNFIQGIVKFQLSYDFEKATGGNETGIDKYDISLILEKYDSKLKQWFAVAHKNSNDIFPNKLYYLGIKDRANIFDLYSNSSSNLNQINSVTHIDFNTYSIDINANVESGSIIRMRLVADLEKYKSVNDQNHLGIAVTSGNLFGTGCFPDFSNPGKCL